MSDPNITREQLKSVLSYSPDTGDFIRIKCLGGQNKHLEGKMAGTVLFDGYISIRIYGVKVKAHRLAWLYMTGEWPPFTVDHRDGNRSNNRWQNLRSAEHHQNSSNQRIHSNNTTGAKGVSWISTKGVWRVQIRYGGDRRASKSFHKSKFYEACEYAEFLREELHGEFARHA